MNKKISVYLPVAIKHKRAVLASFRSCYLWCSLMLAYVWFNSSSRTRFRCYLSRNSWSSLLESFVHVSWWATFHLWGSVWKLRRLQFLYWPLDGLTPTVSQPPHNSSGKTTNLSMFRGVVSWVTALCGDLLGLYDCSLSELWSDPRSTEVSGPVGCCRGPSMFKITCYQWDGGDCRVLEQCFNWKRGTCTGFCSTSVTRSQSGGTKCPAGANKEQTSWGKWCLMLRRWNKCSKGFWQRSWVFFISFLFRKSTFRWRCHSL